MTQLSRTNCEEAVRLLNDFLDRRLTPEETKIIQEHLEICEACTREFTFEASVLDGVRRKLQSLEAPPDLLARIAARLRPPQD